MVSLNTLLHLGPDLSNTTLRASSGQGTAQHPCFRVRGQTLAPTLSTLVVRQVEREQSKAATLALKRKAAEKPDQVNLVKK